MKLRLAAAALILLTSPLAAETAKIPYSEWVTVKNLTTINSVNRILQFGDLCSINVGGTAIKIADDRDRGMVLAKYSTPEPAGGASCPTGILFEVPSDQFKSMTSRAEAAEAEDRSEREHIARLLGQ